MRLFIFFAVISCPLDDYSSCFTFLFIYQQCLSFLFYFFFHVVMNKTISWFRQKKGFFCLSQFFYHYYYYYYYYYHYLFIYLFIYQKNFFFAYQGSLTFIFSQNLDQKFCNYSASLTM